MRLKTVCVLLLLLFLYSGPAPPAAEPGMMGPGMGPGGMGSGGMGSGMMSGIADSVPEKLPAPGDPQWLSGLREVLAMEKLSFIQYTKDAERFEARMPYRMVIPQERDHIEAIRRLFTAYGVPADGAVESYTESKSLTDAYEKGVELERGLAARYERLERTAPDRQSAEVVNKLLSQTRRHLMMFEHAMKMGGHMGEGMGPGMGM